MTQRYGKTPGQLAAIGTVDDVRSLAPGPSDHCRQCHRLVIWASMRAQLGRLLAAGMKLELAIAAIPFCRDCATPIVDTTRQSVRELRAKREAAKRARRRLKEQQKRELKAWVRKVATALR